MQFKSEKKTGKEEEEYRRYKHQSEWSMYGNIKIGYCYNGIELQDHKSQGPLKWRDFGFRRPINAVHI